MTQKADSDNLIILIFFKRQQDDSQVPKRVNTRYSKSDNREYFFFKLTIKSLRNLKNSRRKRISSVKIRLLVVDFLGLSPGNQRAYLLIDNFPCRGIGNYTALIPK